jgi:hypothetical protein
MKELLTFQKAKEMRRTDLVGFASAGFTNFILYYNFFLNAHLHACICATEDTAQKSRFMKRLLIKLTQ